MCTIIYLSILNILRYFDLLCINLYYQAERRVYMQMGKSITIQKIVAILLSKIKFIFLLSAVVGMLFFLYSKFMITPMYSTSAMMYVQNYNSKEDRDSSNDDGEKSESINEKNQKIYVSDIQGSSTLAEICVVLFQNSDEIVSIYDGCSVSMAVQEDTFFVNINVNGPDPQKCANVANQVIEKSKEVFKDNFDYGKIGTIREAKVPYTPYEPRNTKNGFLGVLVGLVAACIIAILLELIDTTIKSDDDIQQMYGIPVFAEIPDFESQSR